MLLCKIEISLGEGFRLQAGIDIAFKGQNGLAGVFRRKVRLPVVKAGGVQVGKLIADTHQGFDLLRAKLTRNLNQLLRIIQQFRLCVARSGQLTLIIQRFRGRDENQHSQSLQENFR